MTEKFKNPPLIEVVFELIYKPKTWNQILLGGFYSGYIQKNFPIIRDQHGIAGSPGPMLIQGFVPVTQFVKDDGTGLVQLSSNMLSVNRFPIYTGWPDFFPIIKDVLEQFSKIIDVENVERVGLRYLNKINVGEQHNFENYERYIKYKPIIPNINGSANSIQLVTEFPINNTDDFLIIEAGTLMPEQNYPAPVALNLSYISKKRNLSAENISNWLNQVANPTLSSTFRELVTEECLLKFN